MEAPTIRSITLRDNPVIAQLIRKVFEDMGVPKKGTAYEDKELSCMFESYDEPNAAYFVLETTNGIVGGAAISLLKNHDGYVCELQKMYFSEEARGKGWGNRLLTHCLAKAKELGYNGCYLETMPNMNAAQQLYLKKGLAFIEDPMGCTGHTSCPVYMYKSL